MNRISIIIPILNEAETISNLLNHLIKNSTKENISEIIIVDGGSTDSSQNEISKYQNITLLNSPKGRAKQMNSGAKHATGTILYFLHADSFPPKNFDTHILNEIQKGNSAGCFRMKFNSNHLWLKLAGWLTKLPFKFCRGGDQSQFITKLLFNEIGGFDENFIIYEDNDLISKLYKINQFVVIQKWLVTSARCYNKNGIMKLQWHYWTIHIKKFFGASPQELNQYYKKYIC
jgi:rSAM/selenodomain-associated transferase 2